MRFAIIEDNKVKNIIIAEAESLPAELSDAQPETEATGEAWIGARFNGTKFEPENFFPSWTWNEETFEYDPPIPKPEGDYLWDEVNQLWVKA